MINVLPMYTRVIIGEKINALITGICIRGTNEITYECSWFSGLNHHSKWIHQYEIKEHNIKTYTKIGFKNER